MHGACLTVLDACPYHFWIPRPRSGRLFSSTDDDLHDTVARDAVNYAYQSDQYSKIESLSRQKSSDIRTVSNKNHSSTLFCSVSSLPDTASICLCLHVMSTPNQAYPYEPPAWALDTLTNTPEHGRLNLGNLPTPLYRMNPFTGSHGINFFVKRDDMTGGPELGGNKIRKLEFLLADALANNYDSVVTIGGEQSNHCRATAAAARMVNLEPHLILRTKRATDLTNFGYTGNILVDRMVGSTLYTCTPGEYGRVGSNELVRRLCAYIESEGDENNNRPYPIPVGGSNGLGSWGYINGVYELLQQWESSNVGSLHHVVFACGSWRHCRRHCTWYCLGVLACWCRFS